MDIKCNEWFGENGGEIRLENNGFADVINVQTSQMDAIKSLNDTMKTVAPFAEIIASINNVVGPMVSILAEVDRQYKAIAVPAITNGIKAIHSFVNQPAIRKIASDIKAIAEPAFISGIKNLRAIANDPGVMNAMRHAFELSQKYHQFVEMIANAKLFKALNTVASIQRRSSYSRSFARERRSPSRSQFTTSRASGGGGSGGNSDPPDPPDRSRSHSNSLSRARKMGLGRWLVSLRSSPDDDEPP